MAFNLFGALVAFIGFSVQSSDDPNVVPAVITALAPEYKLVGVAGAGVLKSVGLAKAAALGDRIGALLAKLPAGKMSAIASNVSSLGLVQAEAAEATAAAVKALGLRSARIAAGNDIIVASVVQGAGKQVLRVAIDGTVTRATADLAVEGGEFVAKNIQDVPIGE